MSLINEMLKDLENRKRGQNKSTNNILQGATSAQYFRAGNGSYYIYINISVVLLLFIIAIYLVVKWHPAAKVAAPAVVNTITQHVASSPNPTQPMPSTLLHAIGITGNKDYTRISMYLNKNAHYSISRNIVQNLLILTLDNTQLAEPLLPMNTKNSAINDVQVANMGSQLQMTVHLNQGIEIQNVELIKGQEPTLTIDLADKNQIKYSPAILHDTNPQDNASLNQLAQAETALQKNTGTLEKVPQPITPEQRANFDIQQAADLSQQNQVPEAINTLKNALIENPADLAARQMLVALLINQKQLTQANNILQQGLQQVPNNPALTKLAAQLAILKGDRAAAIAVLKKVSPPLADDPDYYAYLADLYLSQGQAFEAAKWYEQLTQYEPNNANYWLGLAIALDTLGKAKAAIEAYQNASLTGGLSPQLQNYADNRIRQLRG